MEIISIAGFAVCAVIIVSALNRYTPWASVLITLAVSAAAVFYLLPEIRIVAEGIREIFKPVGKGYAELLLKVVGITFIAQITAQACSDAGQKAMGDKIEFAARVLIAVYTLPLITDILRLISKFLGG